MRSEWRLLIPIGWLLTILIVGLGSYAFAISLNADLAYAAPQWGEHLFGTDSLGRSLLFLILHSIPITLGVSLASTAISLVIAIFIGGFTTYLGNNKIAIRWCHLIPSMVLVSYIIFIPMQLVEIPAFGYAMMTLFAVLLWAIMVIIFRAIPLMRKSIALPFDLVGLRTTEIMAAIPLLIIVLAVAALARNTAFVLIIILGLTAWTRMARLFRGEVLVIKSKPFIKSAEQQGFSYSGIFIRHLLPNSLSPIIPAITFTIASMIIVESSLSFIGIGLPADTITLGKLIQQFFENTHAWWLGLFPGIFLFSIVLSFHRIGTYFERKLQN